MTPAAVKNPQPRPARIAVRARRDLVARPQVFRSRRQWCVKDPVSFAFYHLRDEEFAVLGMLDGTATEADVREAFAKRFPGETLGPEQLAAFLGSLDRSGLVTADAAGQGRRLWERRRARRRRPILQTLTGLLSVRWRGVDPSGLLSWLDDVLGWTFSPAALTAATAFVLAAVVLVASRFDVFLAALPDAAAFFTARNAAVFFVALGIVKVLHELGHGLACVRAGAECHEIGLMLLVFTPCLYCDVSDTWLLPRKWSRIGVAAAGIGVELVLAAAATFVWWSSEPGLLNAFCLNLMLICSVNTLLFNGNPLLRYDGYFVLSDLLEIPNLSAEARSAVDRLIFGREPDDPRLGDRLELTLLTYGLAANAYRLFVTAAIVWLFFRVLTPLGLGPVAYVLAASCLLGAVVGPATGIARATFGPRRRRRRAAAVGLLALAAGAAAAFVPIPRKVEAVAILQPRDAARVYAAVGGRIVEAAEAGRTVAAGESLGRLESPALRRDVVRLEGELAELTAVADALESRRLTDASVASQIPASKQAIAAVRGQLDRRRQEAAGLLLSAPTAGTVLPPPQRSSPESPEELSDWSGTPLDAQNRGATLEPGTLFCLVGDPARLEAVLLVEEGDVELLRPGQPARLLFDLRPDEILDAVVEEIAADPLRTAPPEFAAGGRIAVRRGEDGVVRPVETVYQVRLRLIDEMAGRGLRMRAIGRGKVATAPETLAAKAYRSLRRTFRFRL